MSLKAKKILTVAGLVLFFAGLAVMAYLGRYNRYYSDDWCYNADFEDMGLIGTMKGYTYITHYASNRYALTFLSGLLHALGIFGVQIMTPLVIVLWLGGIFWNLRNLVKISRIPLSPAIVLLASAIVLYYSLYLAPHQYQILYWRTGVLPYTAPLMSSIWVLAVIAHQGTREKPSRPLMILAAGLAYLGGGFSEAGFAYLASIVGLYLGIAAIAARQKQAWASQSLPTALIAFAFAMLAMITLLASPANEFRQRAAYGEPTNLLELPGLVISYGLFFVEFSIKDLPLPHLVIVATFGLLAFRLHPPADEPIRLPRVLLLVLIISAIAFILITVNQAPSAYIEKAPPAPRERIIPRFTMIAALAILAWIAGFVFRQKFQARWLDWVAVILLLLTFAYAARSIGITANKAGVFAERAAIWDERDDLIRQAREQGILEVDVRGIDGQPVGGIRDFKPKPTFWINNCAARYYGVKAIRAILP